MDDAIRHYQTETLQHRQLRDAVWSKLKTWRRFLVAIDGVDGAGKSTLGRYLGWQLEMPVIETDMYLVERIAERYPASH